MVKIAFVGCGKIMAKHGKYLSAHDDAKIVGHCDVNKTSAEKATSEFGGTAFTDPSAMFDKVKPDAVYVCVPPFAHGDIEEAAAERGIHLFIEKPVSIDRETCKRVSAAIRKSKVISSVGYCFRYNDTVEVARKMLKEKAISLVCGSWICRTPETPWRRKMDKSGGQLVEQSTHLFDLARYLCGEVAEVYAVGSNGCILKDSNYSIYDSSSVSLRFKNGAAGCLSSCCVTDHVQKIVLNIVTTDSVFRFDNGRMIIEEDGRTTEIRPKADMFEEENKTFIEAVQSGKKNKIKSSYADAAKTFRATHAANESIESGLPTKP